MITAPDFSKAKDHEELSQMAEEWIANSQAWTKFVGLCPLSLHTLYVYCVTGTWFFGLNLMVMALTGIPLQAVFFMLFSVCVVLTLWVRGRIQDIARECGGIWYAGDFMIPK